MPDAAPTVPPVDNQPVTVDPSPARKSKARKPAPPMTTLNVDSNGSITVETAGTNSFGRPVEMPPVSPTALVNNVICRFIKNPDGTMEPVSPTGNMMMETMRAISAGEDIAPYREQIDRVTANQQEKLDLMRAYKRQMDMEALASNLVVRNNAIHVMELATRQGTITVAEALAAMRQANEVIPELSKTLDDTKNVDSNTLVDKIDVKRLQANKELERKWEGTTPQGREIIRKKLFRIFKNKMIAEGTWVSGLPKKDPPPEDPVDSVLENDGPPPVVTLANPA